MVELSVLYELKVIGMSGAGMRFFRFLLDIRFFFVSNYCLENCTISF